MLTILILVPLIGAITIGVGWWAWERAGGAGAVSETEELEVATVVFTTLALIQVARALSARSFTESIWATGLRGNRVLAWMLVAVLVLQLTVVFLPPAQEVFSTVGLAAWELAAGTAVALLVLSVMELEKRGRRRAGAANRPATAPARA